MNNIFRANILPAIIGAAGSLVVVIIGWIITTYQFKTNIKEEKINLEKTIQHEISQNNKNLIVQYITDKRVDWMYAVRETLSNYISTLLFIAEKYRYDKEAVSDLYRELNCDITKLKLLFNFDGKIDNRIIKLIDKLTQNISDEKFRSLDFLNDINELTMHSQIYLKLEWERVKMETEDNLNKKSIKDLLEKMEDKLYCSYKLKDAENN